MKKTLPVNKLNASKAIETEYLANKMKSGLINLGININLNLLKRKSLLEKESSSLEKTKSLKNFSQILNDKKENEKKLTATINPFLQYVDFTNSDIGDLKKKIKRLTIKDLPDILKFIKTRTRIEFSYLRKEKKLLSDIEKNIKLINNKKASKQIIEQTKEKISVIEKLTNITIQNVPNILKMVKKTVEDLEEEFEKEVEKIEDKIKLKPKIKREETSKEEIEQLLIKEEFSDKTIKKESEKEKIEQLINFKEFEKSEQLKKQIFKKIFDKGDLKTVEDLEEEFEKLDDKIKEIHTCKVFGEEASDKLEEFTGKTYIGKKVTKEKIMTGEVFIANECNFLQEYLFQHPNEKVINHDESRELKNKAKTNKKPNCKYISIIRKNEKGENVIKKTSGNPIKNIEIKTYGLKSTDKVCVELPNKVKLNLYFDDEGKFDDKKTFKAIIKSNENKYFESFKELNNFEIDGIDVKKLFNAFNKTKPCQVPQFFCL